jgi:hypothetical protein
VGDDRELKHGKVIVLGRRGTWRLGGRFVLSRGAKRWPGEEDKEKEKDYENASLEDPQRLCRSVTPGHGELLKADHGLKVG